MKQRTFATLTLCAALMMGRSALAEGDAPKSGQAVRRLQMALRQTQQRNQQLQDQLDASQEQLRQLNQQLLNEQNGKNTEHAQASRLTRQLQATSRERDDLMASVDAAKSQLEQLRSQLQTTQADLQRRVAVDGQLRRSLDESRNANRGCEAKNVTLYHYAVDLLDRYNRKGVGDALLQLEPFSGIKQVEIDNLMQEYGDKLDHERLDAAKPASSASAAP